MIGALLRRFVAALARAGAMLLADELERSTPVPPTQPEPWTYRNVADVKRQIDSATVQVQPCSICRFPCVQGQACASCGDRRPQGKT
jgi:hypothetical protein